jgi:hypothetical protein
VAGERDWHGLAPGTKRRWIGAFGGPRSLAPDGRAERARLAYEGGERLPVEHSGHAGPYESHWSQVVTTRGVREVSATTRVEALRLSDHTADTGRLVSGSLEDEEFFRRWSRRKRSVGGYELESDPDRVIALLTEAGPPPEPFYRRGPQPRRPRR